MHLSLITSVELSHSSCMTVTQGLCNVFPLFGSEDFIFLFSFELITTHSRYNVVRNTFDHCLLILLM